MDNYKYVRIDNIYQRLTQRLKGRDISFEDIVEWCAECELIEIGHFSDWFIFQDYELVLNDREAVLPENCWYIKSIKTDVGRKGRYVDFHANGNQINVRESLLKVYINYIAFPTDAQTGYLLIPRGHENACFWYCLKALLLSDYLDGRLDHNRWNMIENQYQMAVEKAVSQSTRMSDNERDKVLSAMRRSFFNYKEPYR
jgi:hypothetical protein